MTRMSKPAKRRNQSPRKRHYNRFEKTGAKKDNLPEGYKVHENAVDPSIGFFPKAIKGVS